MLTVGAATRVFLAAGVTDLRKSFDGLWAIAEGRLESDPTSGHLFVFCNRRRDRIKVLYWDGSGAWVCTKRLEGGRFSWPEEQFGPRVTLSREELAMLLGGIELEASARRDWWRREAVENREKVPLNAC